MTEIKAVIFDWFGTLINKETRSLFPYSKQVLQELKNRGYELSLISLALTKEKRLAEIERIRAREKLSFSERLLSGVLFERGIDKQGFARVKSKGDQALFGGNTTQGMKNKLGISDKRALADFLPSVTIKARDLANEITSFNVKKDLRKIIKNIRLAGESLITGEHIKNNRNVREALVKGGIVPEALPAEEDIKKLERKIKAENKKLSKETKKLNK